MKTITKFKMVKMLNNAIIQINKGVELDKLILKDFKYIGNGTYENDEIYYTNILSKDEINKMEYGDLKGIERYVINRGVKILVDDFLNEISFQINVTSLHNDYSYEILHDLNLNTIKF